MKPNIFNYAGGELTNDAMICWMLDWANSEDEEYKNLSQDIIRLFTADEDLKVEFVNIKKQYKKIDILVEVNNSEVIVIEDKVKTSHHSNQLERYKEIIESEEQYKDYNKHYIYYKIGNESPYNGVEEAGYKRINRDAMLNVIKKYRSLGNGLLNDYIDYLETLEKTFNKYKYEDDLNKWDWDTWQGYYSNLQAQKNIKEVCWRSVSNPKGGFLAFFWNWTCLTYKKDGKEIDYALYPQIESNPFNSDGNKTRVAFKLECKDSNYGKEIRLYLYERLKNLLEDMEKTESKNCISVGDVKKTRFKIGFHMTIAEINNINTRTRLDQIIEGVDNLFENIL